MWKKLVMFALSSGLAASAWKAWSARQREARERRTDREQIGRWEDEGGALPPPAPPPKP